MKGNIYRVERHTLLRLWFRPAAPSTNALQSECLALCGCLFWIGILCRRNEAMTHFLHFICVADASHVVDHCEMLSRALMLPTDRLCGQVCRHHGWFTPIYSWSCGKAIGDRRESMFGTWVNDFTRSLVREQMSDLAGQKLNEKSKSIDGKQCTNNCCWFWF